MPTGVRIFARLRVRRIRPDALHLWAFDLLAFNGRDLRLQPLVKRQTCLQALLDRFGCPAVSLSESRRTVACGLPRTGERSRRLPGARRTGSDGACLCAAKRRRAGRVA